MASHKHSIRINGNVTSISLEPEYWEEFKLLCEVRGMKVSELATILARENPDNLCSAIRTEILHAKNLELGNMRKMIGAVAKGALDNITPQPVTKVRAVR